MPLLAPVIAMTLFSIAMIEAPSLGRIDIRSDGAGMRPIGRGAVEWSCAMIARYSE
jgi:hypothetical protein